MSIIFRKEISMFEVFCPNCKKTREVKIWQKIWGGPPYIKLCTSCSKLGREQSQESKDKKSNALIGKAKPPEYSERLKIRHAQDGSLRKNLIAGKGGGWNKGLDLEKHSENTKQKISESMKKHNQEKEN